MKTKKDLFLEDMVVVGKGIIRNNLLLDAYEFGDDRTHPIWSCFADMFIGGLGSLYLYKIDNEKAALPLLIASSYGFIFQPAVLCIKQFIEGYKESLEKKSLESINSK